MNCQQSGYQYGPAALFSRDINFPVPFYDFPAMNDEASPICSATAAEDGISALCFCHGPQYATFSLIVLYP